jgi:hypothetical protein
MSVSALAVLKIVSADAIGIDRIPWSLECALPWSALMGCLGYLASFQSLLKTATHPTLNNKFHTTKTHSTSQT